MKKTKKLLSLLTALTITASAFASLVIPASAADDGAVIIEPIDYEGDGAAVDWTSSSTDRFTPILRTVDGNTFLTVDQATRHQNSCTLTSPISEDFTATRYAVEFDLRLGSSAGQDSTSFSINTDDGYLLSVNQKSRNAEWTVNNKETITFEGGGNTWNVTAPETIDAISWLHFTVCYGGGPTYLKVTDPAKTGDEAIVLAQKLVDSGTTTGKLKDMTFISSRYDANFAIDNFTVRNLNENEIPDIKYYDMQFKTQRYAKIAYKLGDEAEVIRFADVNGNFSVTNIKENTEVTYTISKEGYQFADKTESKTESKTETFTITASKEVTAPMTLAEDIGVSESDLIYHENTFGYATDKLDISADNRMCDTNLGEINIADNIYEIMFDVDIKEAETNQVTMAFFPSVPTKGNTDTGDIFGIQGNTDGLFVFSDLQPRSDKTNTQGWNQACAGLYNVGAKLADEYTGTYKVDMIVDKVNKSVTVKAGDNPAQTIPFTKDASKIEYFRISKGGANKALSVDNLIIRRPDQNYVGVSGDTEFAKITGKTVTRQYTAEALVKAEGETFTWTVENNDTAAGTTGVTIDNDGLLSLTDEAVAGTYTIKAASTVGGAVSTEKVGTIEVAIRDVQEYIPEVDVPSAMETGETYNLSVGKIVDALGDDVTEYLNPTWLIDDVPSLDTNVTFNTTGKTGDAVAISAVKEDGVLKSVSSQDVTITGDSTVITAESGSTVMLWDSLEGMKPLAAPQTAPDVTIGEDVSAAVGAKSGILRTYIDGDVTLNLVLTESADPIQYRITVAKYAKVVDYTAGMTTVPVSDLVVSDYITGYKVTVADAHGSQLGQQVVAIADVADDNVALPAINVDVVPEKVEVAPVFKLTEDLTDIYAAPAVLEVPNNTYDIDFEKITEGRVDMKVNGYIVVENAGMGGTGRGVSGTRTYSADNVIVNKGKAVISGDGACELASVTICKTPEIVNRKTHLWIAGDSTVCVYYGNEETGDVKDLQTGWGQVFDTYINKDEATVVDLAESGSYIHRWFYEEYPTVRDMAQPGDYFIVQMGINDRSHGDVTDEADMKALLGQMVDEMRARGVIPVLVTPQKSKGYAWYSADASKGDITKWDGAGIAWSSYGFGTGAMKAVAEDKGTLFVDSASMSAKAFFDLGADYVIDNFHLSNEHASGKEMHFSYAGAQKLASMIAQSIYDQTKAGKTTSKGEKFDGIPVITTGSGFTFTDSTGASQTYNVVDSAN